MGSKTADAVIAFIFVLLAALIVGVSIWYVFGISFLKVTAVSLTLATTYSLVHILEVGWFERPLLLMVLGLVVAVPMGLLFGSAGFFVVASVFLILGILTPFLMGAEGREQAREEWKARREHREREGQRQQETRLKETEQDRLEREQTTRGFRLGRQDGGGGRSVPDRIRKLRAMPYKEYLRTPDWKRRKEDILRTAGYRCQACSNTSGPLDVHHNTYDNLGEELDRDLIVLCRDCHGTFHKHRRLGR